MAIERAPGVAAQVQMSRPALPGAKTPAPEPAKKEISEQVSRTELESRVEKANAELAELHNNLHFAVHEKSGQLVVQVTDSRTGEVIRQQPPKAFLDLTVRLREMVGLFLDEKN